jgi:hypothetical protein
MFYKDDANNIIVTDITGKATITNSAVLSNENLKLYNIPMVFDGISDKHLSLSNVNLGI